MKYFFPTENLYVGGKIIFVICQNNLEIFYQILLDLHRKNSNVVPMNISYMKKHPQKAKNHVNLMNDVPEATLQFLDVFVCVRALSMITFFLDKKCTVFGEV